MEQDPKEPERYRLWPTVAHKPLNEFERILTSLGLIAAKKVPDSYPKGYLCRKYSFNENCSGIRITYRAMTSAGITRGIEITMEAKNDEDRKKIIQALNRIGKLEVLTKERFIEMQMR